MPLPLPPGWSHPILISWARRPWVSGLSYEEGAISWEEVVVRLPSPARGSWGPCPLGHPHKQRPVLSPLSKLGFLPYSAPWNPGPHNTWALSRQVSETLIPVFLWFLIPPATMVSVGPLPCHVPNKPLKDLPSCSAQPARCRVEGV